MLCRFQVLIQQESHNYRKKRDYNHIILEINVILIDLTISPHYDINVSQELDLDGQGM